MRLMHLLLEKKMMVRTAFAGALCAAVFAASLGAVQASEAFKPITIVDQGTFMAGGTVKRTPGTYRAPSREREGQTLHGDHAAVRYQVPENAKALPLVFLHGYGQSSRTWETTADGREGFSTLPLREGYASYLVDQPRRGQAGNSTVPAGLKAATGDQFWFGQFRIGLWPGKFAHSQFPEGDAAMDQFFRMMTPDTGAMDAGVISDGVAAVFDCTGPAILVSHSAGGGLGWLTVLKTENIRAIVSYEPGSGFVFPEGEAPAPVENNGYRGAFKPVMVSEKEFLKLTRYPIVIYYGDNIPVRAVQQPHQDYWRAAVQMAKLWAQTVNRHGGHVEVMQLPDKGLKGNTHFPMSDLNNREVAGLLTAWLHDNGLDAGKTK